MARVKITETVLRDAHQSLIATRMPGELMEPILDTMDQVGYHAVECWGGATFDACLRFLKEDPWERLRMFKRHFKNTKLQMLFRGQNILGYNHYADDVVEYFVEKSIANGIDVIRIFDCLNDIRNLETSVKACKKEGGHAQIALCYTLGDAYTLEYWENLARDVESLGADSLCIKDMAGLLLPGKATELVGALKKGTKLPIEMHTHYTTGMASMTYLKAIEAGADIIDTASTPFSMGTSQPSTDVMVAALEGTEYDTGLDLDKLITISNYFQPYREECIKSGLLSTKVLGVDVKALKYQVPGGMLSNLISQLHQAGKDDKLQEVLEKEFSGQRKKISVNLTSFGFKYGIPLDLHLMFDLRFLPNPYYIESLKRKTGNHKEVQDYVMGLPESQEFYKMLLDMLLYLIPKYEKEGKSHLRIGIGCSGGQHRSATFVNKLYDDLSQKIDYHIGKFHREVGDKKEI